MRAVRSLLLPGALLALAGACRAPSIGLAPSILPNLGLAGSLGYPLGAGAWQLEARFTDQWLDDKSFADNGFPEAGNWTQLDLGALWLEPVPTGEAGWSLRFGATAFEARGEPNLIEEPGEYLGAYVGAGRFTILGGRWLVGPELTLLLASGEDPFVLVPQLTWGVRTSF